MRFYAFLCLNCVVFLNTAFRCHNGRSPAVTIDVSRARKGAGKEEAGEFQFSVDFVPAIRFMEWPEPAENWDLWRLPDVKDRLMGLKEHNVYPCAVAKIHPSGKHYQSSSFDK